MTDREKMIEVIRDWYADEERATWKLADRLIEAGFGIVKNGPTWDDVHDVMSDLEERGIRESDA